MYSYGLVMSCIITCQSWKGGRLDDVREGDCVGLHLSQDGVLEFTVNGESQSIAAENIYTRDTDVYMLLWTILANVYCYSYHQSR